MNAPIDNQVTLFLHLLEMPCPISNQLGNSPSALVIVNHSQNMLIVNASAELRCSATLQCKLSISTVNHPIPPCQMIRTTVKVDANLTSLPVSSFFLSKYQFSRTIGPRKTAATNLWDHSVKIWNVEYLCPEPRESISSGFSAHHSSCSSSETSKPNVPKHNGQSGQDSPASYIRISPPRPITTIVSPNSHAVRLFETFQLVKCYRSL